MAGRHPLQPSDALWRARPNGEEHAITLAANSLGIREHRRIGGRRALGGDGREGDGRGDEQQAEPTGATLAHIFPDSRRLHELPCVPLR
jgi:hypothetical protein